MSTHTPGPWRVKKPRGGGSLEIWRHESNELPIIQVAWTPRRLCHPDDGDAEANANLIAAAPELFAALTAMRNEVRDIALPLSVSDDKETRELADGWLDLIDKANEAIENATGQ